MTRTKSFGLGYLTGTDLRTTKQRRNTTRNSGILTERHERRLFRSLWSQNNWTVTRPDLFICVFQGWLTCLPFLSSKHIFCGNQDERYFCPFQIEPHADEEYTCTSPTVPRKPLGSQSSNSGHKFLYLTMKTCCTIFTTSASDFISGCRLTWKFGNFSNEKGATKQFSAVRKVSVVEKDLVYAEVTSYAMRIES